MNRNEIKKWMIDEGITQAQIAREARVSQALVSMILKGERVNKLRNRESKVQLVITLLKGHGCPEEYLGSSKKPKAA